jgi:methyl-accepting chemotaxis protein
MTGEFDDVYRNLEAASAAIAESVEASARGHEAVVRAVTAARHAHGEQEDLRESVERLEQLVMELLRRANGQKGDT